LCGTGGFLTVTQYRLCQLSSLQRLCNRAACFTRYLTIPLSDQGKVLGIDS
jgi:hypothetical protein